MVSLVNVNLIKTKLSDQQVMIQMKDKESSVLLNKNVFPVLGRDKIITDSHLVKKLTRLSSGCEETN